MRRDEILRAAAAIDGVLERHERKLSDVRRGEYDETGRRYAAAAVIFALSSELAAERAVAPGLGGMLKIDLVSDPQTLQRMYNSSPEATIDDVLAEIAFDRSLIRNLRSLIARDSDIEAMRPPEESPLLRILLPDDDGGVSLEAVANLFRSVATIYAVAAELGGDPPDGIRLVACDSGSPKMFDFKGLDGVIKQVRKFLGERERFSRDSGTEQRRNTLENADHELSLIREIGTARNQGQISPERAEAMQAALIQSSEVFGATGAQPVGIEADSNDIRKQLPRITTRLLSSGGAAEEAPGETAAHGNEHTDSKPRKRRRGSTGGGAKKRGRK
jgi:hypothetical protein